MLFYAIFALLLFLPRYRVLALTCIIGGLVAAGKLFHPTGAVAIAWTDPILLDFVAGAWLGVAWVRPEHRRLIVLLLLVALLLWIPRLVWPGMRGGIEGAGATLILMAVLFFEGRGAGIPEWRPLRLLGDASYSIYLWQIFPLQFCAVVAARLHLPASGHRGGRLRPGDGRRHPRLICCSSARCSPHCAASAPRRPSRYPRDRVIEPRDEL